MSKSRSGGTPAASAHAVLVPFIFDATNVASRSVEGRLVRETYEAAQPARLRLLAVRDRPARLDQSCPCPGGRTTRRRDAAGRERRPPRMPRRTRRRRPRRMRRTSRAGAPTRPNSSPASRPATRSTCSTTCPASPSTRPTPTGAASARRRGNVLINGERFSGKSTDIFTELRRISASNVTRIEIVDGATLNVPGLSGQVANIITASRGLSGNFVWRPQIRAHRTPARLTNGEASINGSIGGTEFTLEPAQQQLPQRQCRAGDGVSRPTARSSTVATRCSSVNGEQPRLSGTIRRDFGDGSILNVNAAYRHLANRRRGGIAAAPARASRTAIRILEEREREHNYELGGDYEFGLGGGRLKLIGLRPLRAQPVPPDPASRPSPTPPRPPASASPRIADETETIAPRRISLGCRPRRLAGLARGRAQPARRRERPVHARSRRRLRAGALPQFGTRPVQEKRAEAMLTYGRPLAPTLTLQASLGGEYSQLSQTGAGGLTRTFYRPKGFVNLAWRPRPGSRRQRPDRARRRPAQFLRLRRLGQCQRRHHQCRQRQSGAAAELGRRGRGDPQPRPLGHRHGAALRPPDHRHRRRHPDRRDRPVAGQSADTRHRATACNGPARSISIRSAGAAPSSTSNLQFQKTSLEDPLTGLQPADQREHDPRRSTSICATTSRAPTGPMAAASSSSARRSATGSTRASGSSTRPAASASIVEHKDVLGLTVRASVDNLLGTNESFSRTFYDGRRNGTTATSLHRGPRPLLRPGLHPDDQRDDLIARPGSWMSCRHADPPRTMLGCALPPRFCRSACRRSRQPIRARALIARNTAARGGAAALDRVHACLIEVDITERGQTIQGRYAAHRRRAGADRHLRRRQSRLSRRRRSRRRLAVAGRCRRAEPERRRRRRQRPAPRRREPSVRPASLQRSAATSSG